MTDRVKPSKTARGAYLPSMVAVFLVVLFVAALFGTRLLQRPAPVEIGHSERYHELKNRQTLSQTEKAELELETCKYKRKRLYFLKSKSFANYDQEKSDYLLSCENILPLSQAAQ